MPKLKIRVKLNEGGEGAPLDQLAAIGKETERFLRFLAQDLGISVPKGRWLARNFANASVSFDSEDPAEYDYLQLRAFNDAFLFCSDFDPDRMKLNGGVQHRTLLQYAKIADALQPHERVGFGIYYPDAEKPYDWRPLTKRRALTLKDRLTETVTYVGSLQGRLHNVTIEPSLSFQIRISRNGELVRCDAALDMYRKLHDAMELPDTLLYVRGRIRARRVDRNIASLNVIDIKVAPNLDDDMYERFFGAAPEYTGALTTEEFVDRARS